MAHSPLKDKTTVSLFWSFIDKFGQQILNFVSMLVLMNIVATEAYGLIASLAIFTAFSSILIDSGFGRALLNRKDLSDADYSSVFYFNISLSVTLYLVLFFGAPLLGMLFNTPSIVPVVRVMFLSLIFNAFGLIFQTIIVKKADFKGGMRINLGAMFLANAIAIAMALMGAGVWALVAQILLYALLRSLFLWFHTRWRPVAVFDGKRLKTFFAFSNKLLFSSILSGVINNIYPSLIATFYPMSQVAYFNQAKKYQDIPFLTFSNTFRSVGMLILSEINDDGERLKWVVSKFVKSIAFLVFPIGLLMIVVAEPAFYLFFKEKWMASVPYFQILTLAGMLSPFIFFFNELFIAKERADFFLGLEAAKGAMLILLIILFFPQGVTGLAVSWVAYTVGSLLLSVIFSGKLIRYSFGLFFKDILPYFLVGTLSAAAAYFAVRNSESDIFSIVVATVLTGMLYMLLCKLLKLEMTKEVDEWFVSLGRKKRGAPH